MDDSAERCADDLDRRGSLGQSPWPVSRHASGRLAGRVALITGGDTSIGRATAVLFAREGADVAFTHLARHDHARELTRAIEREGRVCLPLCGDIGDPAFCEQVVARVVERFGGVDVLVNNLDERRSAPGFFSLFYLTRRFLPYLRDRPGASIINTTSPDSRAAAGRTDDPGPTRAAVGAFTRSLAHNLARAQIRVNTVASADRADASADARAVDLVFLASDEAATVNGALFDGGGGSAPRRRPRLRRPVLRVINHAGPAVRRRRRQPR